MDFERIFSLRGRVALVTGGSRGIGKMIAGAFIAQGARVYISSRDAEACRNTAQELGQECVPLPADISTLEGCDGLVAAVSERETRLDILVNNAGAAWGASFETFPEHGWDKVMNLNLKIPFFLTQKLHGLLKKAGSAEQPAKVINIGSIDGTRLNPWETYSYHASKAGVIYLTKRLAARLVSDNINVTAIAPGAFASEMNRAARDESATMSKAIPSGRIGRNEDMGAAAVFLAANSGNYIVGDTIYVDGGMVNASLGTNFVE